MNPIDAREETGEALILLEELKIDQSAAPSFSPPSDSPPVDADVDSPDADRFALGLACWLQIIAIGVPLVVGVGWQLALWLLQGRGDPRSAMMVFNAGMLFALVTMLSAQVAGLFASRGPAFGWHFASLVVGLIAAPFVVIGLLGFPPAQSIFASGGRIFVVGLAEVFGLVAFAYAAARLNWRDDWKLTAASAGLGALTLLLLINSALSYVEMSSRNFPQPRRYSTRQRWNSAPRSSNATSVAQRQIFLATVRLTGSTYSLGNLVWAPFAIWALYGLQSFARFGDLTGHLSPRRQDLKPLGIAAWLRLAAVAASLAGVALSVALGAIQVAPQSFVAEALGFLEPFLIPSAIALNVAGLALLLSSIAVGAFAPAWANAGFWHLVAIGLLATPVALSSLTMAFAAVGGEDLLEWFNPGSGPHPVFLGILLLCFLGAYVTPLFGGMRLAQTIQAHGTANRGQLTLIAFGATVLLGVAIGVGAWLFRDFFGGISRGGEILALIAIIAQVVILWLEVSFLWTLQAEIYSDEPLPEGLESA